MNIDDIKAFIYKIQKYNNLLKNLSYKACFFIFNIYEEKAILVGKDASRFAGHIKNTSNPKVRILNEIKTNGKSGRKDRKSYIIKMDP